MATSFSLLKRVSGDTIEPAVLQRLQAFAGAHDSLVALNPQGSAPVVQLQSLEGFLRDHFSGSFATSALARFQREDSSHLTDNQSWPRADWAGLSQHGAPIAPPHDSTLTQLVYRAAHSAGRSRAGSASTMARCCSLHRGSPARMSQRW